MNWVHEKLVVSDHTGAIVTPQRDVVVDGHRFLACDYGSTAGDDFNMCFYLCVCDGDRRSAILLKDILTPLVRPLDEPGTWFGARGQMVEADVIYTYVAEWEQPLCIVDEATGRYQRIRPRSPSNDEPVLYLLRTAGEHYIRLVPDDGHQLNQVAASTGGTWDW